MSRIPAGHCGSGFQPLGDALLKGPNASLDLESVQALSI
jgi:hypothetical protein